MNPKDIPGVVAAPLYTSVPCEDSTEKLAEALWRATGHMGTTAPSLELNILRWLVDNKMAIVRLN